MTKQTNTDRPSIDRFWSVIDWLRARLARPTASGSTSTQSDTEAMIRALARLGGGMIVAIMLVGLCWLLIPATCPRGTLPITFLFWSIVVAFAACLAGGALGLLFGLPISIRRGDATANDGPNRSTGYLESTSLEQIADFLVKGIVALTLTSFRSWSIRFDIMSANITRTLLGDAMVNPAPGGLLVSSFALLGFLIAYLWMRRWFIGELVLAQNEQALLLLERSRDEARKLAEAQQDDRQGVGTSAANNAAASAQVATRMADAAVTLTANATPAATASAREIARAVVRPTDPDDPWKNAFGGLAADNGCVLSANVGALIGDLNNFQVTLLITISDARRIELAGKTVYFFLHPTFGSEPRRVPIVDGRATLQIFSYGAFTVGALIQDGTRLELDLAQIAGAPARFLQR